MASIGEAARRSGVSIETIRYYERKSVVRAPGRTASGRRDYTDGDIVTLRFIRRCRDLGFPLSDIRVLLSLADGEVGPCENAKAIGLQHLDQVRTKMADLAVLERSLSTLVSHCDGSEADCPMLDRLFAEGEIEGAPPMGRPTCR